LDHPAHGFVCALRRLSTSEKLNRSGCWGHKPEVSRSENKGPFRHRTTSYDVVRCRPSTDEICSHIVRWRSVSHSEWTYGRKKKNNSRSVYWFNSYRAIYALQGYLL